MMNDLIEFYDISDRKRRIASVSGSIVPRVEEFINIRRETWSVELVTYALDYAGTNQPQVRAIVDLRRRPEHDPK